MSFIYHAVPAKLVGDTLLPLFTLRAKHPEIFATEMKKYADHPQRKELPFLTVKKLGCVRGEVLQCSPIHPSLIFAALKSVFPAGNRSVKFFKIPVKRLQGIPMVLFDINRPGWVFGEEEPESVFDLIDIATYREISAVPVEAFAFYQEWKARGEPGAPAWGKIPHVMVQGPISIAGCEIIDWRESSQG